MGAVAEELCEDTALLALLTALLAPLAAFLPASAAFSMTSSGFLNGSSESGSYTSFLITLFISSCALRNLPMALPSVFAIAGSLSGPNSRKPNSRMRKSSNPPIPNKAFPFACVPFTLFTLARDSHSC